MNSFEKKDNMPKRYLIVILLAIPVVAFLCLRLFYLQVIMGDYYSEQAVSTSKVTTAVKAPRGEIFDRTGRQLVKNSVGYSAVINKLMFPSGSSGNDMLLEISVLLRNENVAYYDSLPISSDYPLEPIEGSESAYSQLCEKYSVDSAISLIAAMADDLGVDTESLTYLEQRLVVGILYEMNLRGFSNTNKFVLAENIDINTATALLERQYNFPGLEIETEPTREYVYSGLMSHILGWVGPIYKNEYETLKEHGYSLNDTVGKDGIEKIAENTLKGTDGYITYLRTSSGKVTTVIEKQDAKAGNNVMLTIDLNLQLTAEKALAEQIEKVRFNAVTSGRERSGEDAYAGAVIAMDPKTGDVLASASYPTYNLETYNRDYNAIVADPYSPLMNRVISGLYPPGSTFKMAVAYAGLQSEVIDLSTTVTDKGYYEYGGRNYYCWIYSEKGLSHGRLNVVGAIQNSCNIFFYEIGRILGIDRLNQYTRYLGFGNLTGIELLGERRGVLAGREYSESIGKTWYGGETLQAAIGQSDNLVTPIQLAAYVSTLVNGGTYYVPHIIKSTLSPYYGEIITEKLPEVREKIEMKQATYEAIIEGMREVASAGGTSAGLFANYRIQIGAKTGTASVGTGSPHGVFVACAPYNDPEIVIAVIIEHGNGGNNAAPVAKAILDTWLDTREDQSVYNVGGIIAP